LNYLYFRNRSANIVEICNIYTPIRWLLNWLITYLTLPCREGVLPLSNKASGPVDTTCIPELTLGLLKHLGVLCKLQERAPF